MFQMNPFLMAAMMRQFQGGGGNGAPMQPAGSQPPTMPGSRLTVTPGMPSPGGSFTPPPPTSLPPGLTLGGPGSTMQQSFPGPLPANQLPAPAAIPFPFPGGAGVPGTPGAPPVPGAPFNPFAQRTAFGGAGGGAPMGMQGNGGNGLLSGVATPPQQQGPSNYFGYGPTGGYPGY